MQSPKESLELVINILKEAINDNIGEITSTSQNFSILEYNGRTLMLESSLDWFGYHYGTMHIYSTPLGTKSYIILRILIKSERVTVTVDNMTNMYYSYYLDDPDSIEKIIDSIKTELAKSF